MDNSAKYFCNKSCEYYPCHKEAENINCLFCYCPLYSLKSCPGNYKITETDGKQIKDCSGCVFPHLPENYEIIIKFLEKFSQIN